MANKPCNKCEAEIFWPDGWKESFGGPANADGTAHKLTCGKTPQQVQQQITSGEQPQTVAPITNEDRIRFAQLALNAFLETVNANDLDSTQVKDQLGAVFNTAMIQGDKR